jgi:hypothetical protein
MHLKEQIKIMMRTFHQEDIDGDGYMSFFSNWR